MPNPIANRFAEMQSGSSTPPPSYPSTPNLQSTFTSRPSSPYNTSRKPFATASHGGKAYGEKAPPETPPLGPTLYSYPGLSAAPEAEYSPSKSPGMEQAEKTEPATRRRRRLVAAAVLMVVVIGVGVGAGVGITMSKRGGQNLDAGSLSGLSSSAPVPVGVATSAAKTATAPKASGSATVVVAGSSSTARRMVVFGASYCDNGHSRSSKYSGSLLPSPYVGGRHSNGPVWDEYLAQLISVGGANNTDMRNYAYAGAMIDNNLFSAAVPDVKAQMDSFVADVASGLVAPLPLGGKTLVVIWAGLNPVMGIWQSTTRSSASLSSQAVSTAQSQITQEASALLSQINALRANVTQADFLVLPLPPTEIIPYAVYSSNGNSAWLNLYASLTVTFNTALLAGVAAMKNSSSSTVLTYDMVSLYGTLISNPSLDGLTDVHGACVMGSTVCSSPATHLWWDSIHMTTTVHSYIATKLAPTIKSLWKQQ